MPAARRAAKTVETEVETEVKAVAEKVERDAKDAVYAVIHILPNFTPGTRIDGKIGPEQLKVLLDQGDASHEKPADAAE